MLEMASSSENHRADLLGLETAETPVPRGKGTMQREPELRMLRNTASMNVQPLDRCIRALGNSKHWECLGRGYISDHLFVWDSNSYSLFGLFSIQKTIQNRLFGAGQTPLPNSSCHILFFKLFFPLSGIFQWPKCYPV